LGHHYVEGAVREGWEGRPWEQLVGQVLLGGKEWLEKWRRQIRGCQREQPQLKSIGTRPTWGELVAAVEELRGLAWKQMRGKRGDWGRDLVWYVGRKLGGMSLKTLGEQAGGSDYASVVLRSNEWNGDCRKIPLSVIVFAACETVI
jgi:hypothetical protein